MLENKNLLIFAIACDLYFRVAVLKSSFVVSTILKSVALTLFLHLKIMTDKKIVLNAFGLVLVLNTHYGCYFDIKCHVYASVKVDIVSCMTCYYQVRLLYPITAWELAHIPWSAVALV